ncbi:MAG TPA: glutamate synthase subunit beta [Candidatus Omnitrophota bacterium]|nr:glutamate synthase subunit beta [Candidatus Omnitrophota bacterium]
MGDIRGFLKLSRQEREYRDIGERVCDFNDVACIQPEKKSRQQASRCMDCGTPFCHWACPVGNYIPEWNDHLYRGNWEKAFELLDASNNLPEVTSRVCPALCEYSCVLGLNDDAVTIRDNELAVINYGFKKGYIRPKRISKRTGKKIAVVGSGPAGLSCAAQLNKAGHSVVVFEKDKAPGGILRFGIPDFKLEKNILDRRIDLYKKEGIVFKTGVDANDYGASDLLNDFDAICLACGSRAPRDLKIEGRELKGVVFAMDYLIQSNRRFSGEKIVKDELIDANKKNVVIIGGGDTGADCLGVAIRQGALSVTQIEVLPRPPEARPDDCPWPKYPVILKTSSSHKEGGKRLWSVTSKKFTGSKGHVKKILCQDKDGTEFELEADLVILAIGFLHTEHSQFLKDLNIVFDERGSVKAGSDHMTSCEKVFTAGDMRRGQSLVVWAISEGRRAAFNIDKFLMGKSSLP